MLYLVGGVQVCQLFVDAGPDHRMARPGSPIQVRLNKLDYSVLVEAIKCL